MGVKNPLDAYTFTPIFIYLLIIIIIFMSAAGMITPEMRNNKNSRQEQFKLDELVTEEIGGCYISYRKIAFAFVFVLALCIVAAFVIVHLNTPPEINVSIT